LVKAHIIPESYLNGFVDPLAPPKHTPFVWLYDFASQEWSRRAPRKVARRANYYALPDKTGKERDELEHELMGGIEGRAAGIVRRKIATMQELTAEEKEWYALFIGLMMARVPAYRERMDRLMRDMLITPVHQLSKHNPQLFDEIMRAYEEQSGNKAPSAADFALVEQGKIKVRASQSQHLVYLSEVMRVALAVISRMRWIFCHAADGHWFITSDNPVSLMVPKRPEWGLGLARRDIQLQFPVTRNIGLWAVWGMGEDMHLRLPDTIVTADGTLHEVPEELVTTANIQTIAHAQEFIACPAQEFPGAESLEHKEELPGLLYYAASEEDGEGTDQGGES
jgi:hypothetical protein